MQKLASISVKYIGENSQSLMYLWNTQKSYILVPREEERIIQKFYNKLINY